MKAGATAGRVAGTVVSRTERRTKTGNKMGIIGLSDPSGHYEAVIFAEGLQQYRDLLEPGRAVLLGAHRRSAGRRGARAHPDRSSRSTRRPRKLQKGLRVFLRDQAPIEPVAKRLEAARATARSAWCCMLGGGAEVEIRLPGRFKVSPQIAGAIKAVPGVLDVQLV